MASGRRPPPGPANLDLFAPRGSTGSAPTVAPRELRRPDPAATQQEPAPSPAATQQEPARPAAPAADPALAALEQTLGPELDGFLDELREEWPVDLPPGDPPAAAAAPPRRPRRPAAKQQEGAAPIAAKQQEPVASPAAPAPPATSSEPRVYTVGEVVRLAGRALEARFSGVWIEGEVSNCRTPGHVYFTLKDQDGQLPAMMWRSDAQRLKFRLTDGMKVRARGRLSIYAEQGKFQLYVDAVEPAGLGALQAAYEQLKRRLEAEGLFAAARKRPLPFLPRRIGVATSPTGAAVRDIVRVATRRGPARLLVCPCQVQGDAAPGEIIAALRWLERQADVDVIIVGRGGGSIEDLWAFNDEAVARAIAACRVPVISAVGHEVDFTIADFVADQRAATPSQAAELAVPVHRELERRIEDLSTRLQRAGRRSLGDARQGLDDAVGDMAILLRRSIGARRTRLAEASRRLASLDPRARVGRDRAVLERLRVRLDGQVRDRLRLRRRLLESATQELHAAMQQTLARRQRAFEAACGKLDALSPLKVLDRGYGLVRGPRGEVVTRAAQVGAGDVVTVRLASGALDARVERVREGDGGDGEGGPAGGAGA